MLPEKCIYWESYECLLISDVHLGKVDHFRKNGIGIPSGASMINYTRLSGLFNRLKPRRVIFLGDLFHSDQNTDWFIFQAFIKNYQHIQFTLIKGNHDIIQDEKLQSLMDEVIDIGLELGPFYLTHEPLEHHSLYNLCGHIHPAVRLRGKGLQSVRLPCFYFKTNQCILPAFGSFTGGYTIEPKNYEDVFVVAENEVIPLRT